MTKKIISIICCLTLVITAFSSLFSVSAVENGTDNNAVGTTYYVSTLTGKDTNNGTSEDTPFYSLTKINDITLQPGDKVLLERGSVFNYQYLHIKGSGSAENPIVIGTYGDESAAKPVIDAKGQGIWYQDYGTTLDNAQHVYKGYVSSTVLLYDVEYIEISGLEIVNNVSFENEDYSLREKMNRTGVAVVAQNKGTIDHIQLKDLYIHDVRGNVYDKHMNNGGIYFTVFKPENEDTTGIAKYDDVLIENCFVENVSRWGIALAYTAYHAQFNAAEISDDVCQKYGATNVVIKNNYIKDVGGDSITTMYCFRPVVEYNVSDGAAKEINDQVYSATTFGKVAAAVWPWKCKDSVFQYNEVFDTHINGDGQAWDADWGDGTVYQYNYSHNNEGGCVMVCGEQAINTVFRYNISYKDLIGALDLPGNPRADFYNNVFYMAEGVPFIRERSANGVAVLTNNIIYNAGETKTEDWSNNCTVTYDHNLYYNYNETPSDSNAVVGDPLFWGAEAAPTDTTGVVHDRSAFEGFKVSEGSPAINAGAVIAGFDGTDFFGNKITDGTPDIGVYEYQEGDAPSGDVDKTDLNAAIEKAKGLEDYTNKNGTYTAATYKTFSDALAKAEQVAASDTATQLDVIAAANSLNSAINGLKKTDPNFYTYKEDFTVSTSGAWLQWSSTDGQSSGVASQDAANNLMFDGKTGGFWLSETDVPNVYIDVVFGDTAQTVKGIQYVARDNNNNKIKTLEVLVSENGTEYTSVKSYDVVYDGINAEIIFDEPITAKYIRLKPTAIQNDGSTNDPNKLAVSELKVMKPEKTVTYEKGDVNHSGTVDINDVTLIQQYLTHIELKVFDKELADMNNDDTITIIDATLIQIQIMNNSTK